VIGGKLASIGSNARLGNGEYIVAEADESDGSFLRLSPTISVITNIDREHLDYYRNIEEIKEAFLKFANTAYTDEMYIFYFSVHKFPLTILRSRLIILNGLLLKILFALSKVFFDKSKACSRRF